MAPRAEEGFARLQTEILGEKAAALRRIAETLESLLREADRQARAFREASGSERRRHLERHAAVRAEARLYRWYLVVQREAVGLLRHEVLDRIYPLPAPIREEAESPLRPPSPFEPPV